MDSSSKESIEDIPWYHANLTRNGAEVLLLAYGCEGSYLLRPSKNNPGNYTVSVKSVDSVRHFPLVYDKRKFVFGVGEFFNVEQLLEHFQNFPIIAGDTGQAVTLAYPYPSTVKEPSVYEDITRHVVRGSSLKCHTFSNPISPEKVSSDMDWSVASKEGFLTKRGAVHKNWKRRWFVTNRYMLQYYNQRGDKKPLRVLDLRLAEEVFKNDTCGKPNAFSLVFPDRTFFLYADSVREMQEWIELLKWKLNKVKLKTRCDTL
ncbi:dual adapter for phosphotyrosine and 3-phosphotyrosine and 3-phosphoinositide-like [Pocillopora verrucosa]|uniref:dual adapter for phosphotyrosine and 3-phosphotyrosine and 3-phosphoinositide-like n=1 Tax=Pocillopora verrucosa TaxID=203993 RepID=UPI0027974B90|nr:dual adapter for phosphotyrosine and 3-phosphotyrosine and 3-phosphoinositide-like [Pocillopora verrucosa]